jgi:hypothetical protein
MKKASNFDLCTVDEVQALANQPALISIKSLENISQNITIRTFTPNIQKLVIIYLKY